MWEMKSLRICLYGTLCWVYTAGFASISFSAIALWDWKALQPVCGVRYL